MNYIKTAFFIFCISQCLLIHGARATAPEITNMIFFGDSLTDIGNNNWIVIDGNVGTPITNPNSQKLKFMWPNYLVQKKLNKPVYPSSQPNISPSDDSVSYAYAGAETSDQYNNTNWPPGTQIPTKNPDCTQPGSIKDQAGNTTSTCNPGLIVQVDLYLKSVHFMPNPKTLFFIWAGSNDLYDYFNAQGNKYITTIMTSSPYSGILPSNSVTAPIPSQDSLNILEQTIIHNINTAKQKLIDAGVKPDMIYILNLPDLSSAPALRNNHNWKLTIFINKENLEESLNAVSQDLNQKLQTQQDDPKYTIPSSHYLQIYDMLSDMLNNPSQYKITTIIDSCVEKNALPDCTGYLFYDQKHPTTTTHEFIADAILRGL